MELSKISCYEERLFCMMLRAAVTDSLAELGQKLTNFRLVCEVYIIVVLLVIKLLSFYHYKFINLELPEC